MTFTLVQSQKANTGSLTLSSGTTSGNLLVVCAMPYQSTGNPMPVTGVTLGGQADNFASAVIYSGASSGYGQGASIWFDTGCAAGQTAVAVSGTNLGWTYGGIAAFEFATDGDMLLDQVSSNTVASSSWTSGTTATTTSPDEILIGCGCIYDVPNNPDASWPSPLIVNTFASAAYRIVSSEGQYAYFGTTSSGPLEVASIATFKLKPATVTLSGSAAISPLHFSATAIIQNPSLTYPGSVTGSNTATATAVATQAAASVSAASKLAATVTAGNAI